MLQNQRACQLVRSKTGCEPLALAVAWGARTAGRCARRGAGSREASALFRPAAGDLCRPRAGHLPEAGVRCRGALPAAAAGRCGGCVDDRAGAQRGALLRACLDSILHQNTTRRLQVLAVEDGSTDGSGAILAEYARQGGVTVLHPEQGGSAARARNTGLARAVGRWVLFVDCDDCLLPDAVETLLAAQARTGADIVQGGWQYCDEADTRGAVQQYAEACYTGPRRLDVVELPGTPWGKLYRRTLFERVRFPSGYTCFEDAMIHFWVFPRAKCIASTKPVVYLWRKNTMGLTATSQNTAKALQAYWVAEEMLDGAVRLGLPQDALFACNLILQLANYCYVCVAGLPEADPADGLCLLLPAVPPVGNEAARIPRTLPYAVRLAQRALEQADYGLWQLQGRLFQLIN